MSGFLGTAPSSPTPIGNARSWCVPELLAGGEEARGEESQMVFPHGPGVLGTRG